MRARGRRKQPRIICRYREGIDNFLTTLDAQRSSYSAQRLLVQTRLTQAQNLVDLYQALGGDELLRRSPIAAPSVGPAG